MNENTQSGIVFAMMQIEIQKEKENENCPCKTER
jgi:hypothetical protein